MSLAHSDQRVQCFENGFEYDDVDAVNTTAHDSCVDGVYGFGSYSYYVEVRE